MPKICKNSFVLSASCPDTIFEGRTFTISPVANASTHVCVSE